jgi:hypothetical protein
MARGVSGQSICYARSDDVRPRLAECKRKTGSRRSFRRVDEGTGTPVLKETGC